MNMFDEKFTKAYQQELMRIATSEYDVQDDPNLHQALQQVINEVRNHFSGNASGVFFITALVWVIAGIFGMAAKLLSKIPKLGDEIPT